MDFRPNRGSLSYFQARRHHWRSSPRKQHIEPVTPTTTSSNGKLANVTVEAVDDDDALLFGGGRRRRRDDGVAIFKATGTTVPVIPEEAALRSGRRIPNNNYRQQRTTTPDRRPPPLEKEEEEEAPGSAGEEVLPTPSSAPCSSAAATAVAAAAAASKIPGALGMMDSAAETAAVSSPLPSSEQIILPTRPFSFGGNSLTATAGGTTVATTTTTTTKTTTGTSPPASSFFSGFGGTSAGTKFNNIFEQVPCSAKPTTTSLAIQSAAVVPPPPQAAADAPPAREEAPPRSSPAVSSAGFSGGFTFNAPGSSTSNAEKAISTSNADRTETSMASASPGGGAMNVFGLGGGSVTKEPPAATTTFSSFASLAASTANKNHDASPFGFGFGAANSTSLSSQQSPPVFVFSHPTSSQQYAFRDRQEDDDAELSLASERTPASSQSSSSSSVSSSNSAEEAEPEPARGYSIQIEGPAGAMVASNQISEIVTDQATQSFQQPSASVPITLPGTLSSPSAQVPSSPYFDLPDRLTARPTNPPVTSILSSDSEINEVDETSSPTSKRKEESSQEGPTITIPHVREEAAISGEPVSSPVDDVAVEGKESGSSLDQKSPAKTTSSPCTAARSESPGPPLSDAAERSPMSPTDAVTDQVAASKDAPATVEEETGQGASELPPPTRASDSFTKERKPDATTRQTKSMQDMSKGIPGQTAPAETKRQVNKAPVPKFRKVAKDPPSANSVEVEDLEECKKQVKAPVPKFRTVAKGPPVAFSSVSEMKDLDECKKQFRARPLPESTFERPPTTPRSSATRSVTSPSSPVLHTSERTRKRAEVLALEQEMKIGGRQRELLHREIVKAKRIIPGLGDLKPFDLHSTLRHEEYRKKLDEERIQEEAERRRQTHFLARPYQSLPAPDQIRRSERAATTPEPFHLQTTARHHAHEAQIKGKLTTHDEDDLKPVSVLSTEKAKSLIPHITKETRLEPDKAKSSHEETQPPPTAASPFGRRRQMRLKARRYEKLRQKVRETEKTRTRRRSRSLPGRIRSDRPTTTTDPFDLKTETRRRLHEEKFRHKLEAEEEERKKLVNFKASPLPGTTYEYTPDPYTHDPFNFKGMELRLRREEKRHEQLAAEEEEIKRLKKLSSSFRANPIPITTYEAPRTPTGYTSAAAAGSRKGELKDPKSHGRKSYP